jgi:hypothetical protein
MSPTATPTRTKKPIKLKPCSYDHGSQKPCDKERCYVEVTPNGYREVCDKGRCYVEVSPDGYREGCDKGRQCQPKPSHDFGSHKHCHKGLCPSESCDRDSGHEPCDKEFCLDNVKFRMASAQGLALAPVPTVVKRNLRVAG